MFYLRQNRIRCRNALFQVKFKQYKAEYFSVSLCTLQLLDLDAVRELEDLKEVTPLNPAIRSQLSDFFHPGDDNLKMKDLMDKLGEIKCGQFDCNLGLEDC